MKLLEQEKRIREAEKTVDMLRCEVKTLQKSIESIRAENKELKNTVEELRRMIQEMTTPRQKKPSQEISALADVLRTQLQQTRPTNEPVAGSYAEQTSLDLLKYETAEICGKTGIRITGFTGFDDEKTIVIPAHIEGKKVLAVGAGAFMNCKIETVILPDSIVVIGKEAFLYCNKMARINLPPQLAEIHEDAFRGCAKLKKITLPSTLIRLGEASFCYTGIEEIYIPARIREIPDRCFSGCRSLKTVVIANGVKAIEYGAFSNTAIKRIIIPETVEYIGFDAFETDIKHVAFLSGTTSFHEKAFKRPRPRLYVHPNSAVQTLARQNGFDISPLSDFPVQE